MKIESVSTGQATITLPEDEIHFLCNAINETLAAINKSDFRTRTGETQERAEDLWQQLDKILDKIRKYERSV